MELQEEEKFGNQMYTTKMKYWGQQGVSLKTQYMLGSPGGLQEKLLKLTIGTVFSK
jgi:hypothetical protein